MSHAPPGEARAVEQVADQTLTAAFRVVTEMLGTVRAQSYSWHWHAAMSCNSVAAFFEHVDALHRLLSTAAPETQQQHNDVIALLLRCAGDRAAALGPGGIPPVDRPLRWHFACGQPLQWAVRDVLQREGGTTPLDVDGGTPRNSTDDGNGGCRAVIDVLWDAARVELRAVLAAAVSRKRKRLEETLESHRQQHVAFVRSLVGAVADDAVDAAPAGGALPSVLLLHDLPSTDVAGTNISLSAADIVQAISATRQLPCARGGGASE